MRFPKTVRLARVATVLLSLVMPQATILGSSFVRGDTDGSGDLAITDAIRVFGYLFLGNPGSLACLPAADPNDDGRVEITDGIFLLNFLFAGGPPPADPYPGCGPDPTPDAVECAEFPPCAPPRPPELDPVESPTALGTIDLRGVATPGALLRVTGGSIAVEGTSGPDGRFSIRVALLPNRISHLLVTAVDAARGNSPPAALRVVQDGKPPTLSIDEPGDGSETIADSVTVAGRVGDLLSGFRGLQVRVGEAPASVDVGIGTNGTFERTAVPLAPGPNAIVVTATDGVGNSTERTVTVRRVELDPTRPRLVLLDGLGQTGRVHSELPDPIRVRLERPDGSPLVGKTVTFDVARNDGRLAPAAGTPPDSRVLRLQDRTGEDGEAAAYWTLGSDAGCGNNRVRVTSRDVQGSITVCASATAAPPNRILIGRGDSQRVETGAPAPEPLVAWVTDGCSPVEGVDVTFRVASGSGLVDGAPEAVVRTGRTGHAEVLYTLGAEPGNQAVEATFAGNPGLPARFTAFAIERRDGSPTSFSGVVLDNSSQPVGGATVLLFLRETGAVFDTESGIDGRFRFDDLPGAGPAYVSVDGLTADRVGGADGADVPPGSFPSLVFEPVLVPNAPNKLSSPVLLPPLDPRNVREYSTTADTELAVVGVEGLRMIVRAGSMRLLTGDPAPGGTLISLNQVHHDDTPMPMPDGASPLFAWTLQPSRATFDPPIEIRYPNMAGIPAGGIAYFLSFDHDTNRFEIVASGQVDADGAEIVSDPGSGLTVAGWGCSCPPYSVTGRCDFPEQCDKPSSTRSEDDGCLICLGFEGEPGFNGIRSPEEFSHQCSMGGDCFFYPGSTCNDLPPEILPPPRDPGGNIPNSAPQLLIAAGGRSAIASAFGVFCIPNVPAVDRNRDGISDEFLRVTGVSSDGDATRYAFSDPFQLRQGETYVVDRLTITETPPPLPRSIILSAESDLLAVGDELQLAVEGTLGDGSVRDVTRRSDWTTYRTSNPAIATVGDDGLLTAVAPGYVAVTAINEAATSVRRLRVARETVSTTVEGFVLLPDGAPAVGAEVRVHSSDPVAADDRGAFSVPVVVADTVRTIPVVASLSTEAGIITACGTVEPTDGGISDAGLLRLGASGGQALELGNTTFENFGYVRIPDHDALEPEAFTAEAWITPLGAGFAGAGDGGVQIFAKGVEGGCCWQVPWALSYFPACCFRPAGTVRLDIANRSLTGGRTLESGVVVPVGSTAHVAATFDGATMRIVIDGELAAEGAYGLDGIAWGPDDLLVGAGNFVGSARRGFQGVVDEVRFWNYARDPDTIAREMHLKVRGDEPGLVGAWSFDAGDARDDTGNGHDGVLEGPAIAPAASRSCTTR